MLDQHDLDGLPGLEVENGARAIEADYSHVTGLLGGNAIIDRAVAPANTDRRGADE
jgi:hypothetical protein